MEDIKKFNVATISKARIVGYGSNPISCESIQVRVTDEQYERIKKILLEKKKQDN